MPPLSSEEFSAGRQVKRGSTTYDVLDTFTGASGSQFALLRSGSTVKIVPASELREEESDFQSVSLEEQEENRQKAAETT